MKQRTPVFVNILIIVVLLTIFYYLFVQNYSFFSSPYFWGTVVIGAIMAYIHSAIGDLIENNKFKKLSAEEKAAYLAEKRIPYFKRLYAAAFKKQSDTEEKDILIDHGFDGITELDNSLPKWWLGLFYFTIAFCVIYLVAFSFTDYAHPEAELNTETKQMLASIEEFEKTAPQINLESAKYNADNIAEGEELFKTNCVTCHGDNGKGGIGPNLTDTHWINIKQESLFKNVFWMLENGSPNNPTMRPFIKEGTITGRDAEKIAAYIYHINQEKAPITQKNGGAAPQGEVAQWKASND